jgi:hypothetical protein
MLPFVIALWSCFISASERRENAVRFEIIERVKRVGGDIIYVDELPTSNVDSYRSLLRQSDILPVLRTDNVPSGTRQIAIVDLRYCTLSDADLRILRRLREIRYLDLSHAEFPRDSLAHLREMSNLIELDISGSFDGAEAAELDSSLPTTLIHRYPRMGSRTTMLRLFRRAQRAREKVEEP